MKKTLILILALVMVASTALISVGAEATEEKAGPLIITEIFNNPGGTDFCEFMEIMNISDTAIDLYDYKFWYRSGSKLSDIGLPEITSKSNVLATGYGENVLDPGEIAVVWFVHDSFCAEGAYAYPEGVEWWYKTITESEKANYEYTITDYTGTIRAYNITAFRTHLKAYYEKTTFQTLDAAFDSAKVIVCHANIDLVAPAEGGKTGADAHFNLANTSGDKAVKYYITDNNIDVIDENTKYYSTAGIDAIAGTSNHSFSYTFGEGVDMVANGYTVFITPGYLSALDQPEVINARHELNPEKYTETAEVATTTEKVENVTTTEEETNPPKQPEVTTTKTEATTTAKPETTTKAPDNTTAAVILATET